MGIIHPLSHFLWLIGEKNKSFLLRQKLPILNKRIFTVVSQLGDPMQCSSPRSIMTCTRVPTFLWGISTPIHSARSGCSKPPMVRHAAPLEQEAGGQQHSALPSPAQPNLHTGEATYLSCCNKTARQNAFRVFFFFWTRFC